MIRSVTVNEGQQAATQSTWWDGISDSLMSRATQTTSDDDAIGATVEACVACYHQCRECCYATLMRETDNNRAVEKWLDCAALCMTCAMLTARGSDLMGAAAALCARSCDLCLDEMKSRSGCPWEDCAAACMKAAACCRAIAAAAEQY